MQVLINAVDKATKAGVYGLEEISLIMQSLEGLGQIAKAHQEGLALQRKQVVIDDEKMKKDAQDQDKDAASNDGKGK